MKVIRFIRVAVLMLLGLLVVGQTNGQSIGIPVLPLGEGPWTFDTWPPISAIEGPTIL